MFVFLLPRDYKHHSLGRSYATAEARNVSNREAVISSVDMETDSEKHRDSTKITKSLLASREPDPGALAFHAVLLSRWNVVTEEEKGPRGCSEQGGLSKCKPLCTPESKAMRSNEGSVVVSSNAHMDKSQGVGAAASFSFFFLLDAP